VKMSSIDFKVKIMNFFIGGLKRPQPIPPYRRNKDWQFNPVVRLVGNQNKRLIGIPMDKMIVFIAVVSRAGPPVGS